MKTLITLLLCACSVSLGAQVNEEIRRAMDESDYEKVIGLTEANNRDSLGLRMRVQALKAMNRYREAVAELDTLLWRDSTNTKVLVDLAECHKMTGNLRRAACCFQKAVELQPENTFFRLQYIRSLLASEDYEEARKVCHAWLERDTCSATGFKYLGQAYEGLQDAINAFAAYNMAYRRDSLDAQTVASIAGIFNDNRQFKDAVELTEHFRLSDTTSIDVNRQNAKAYCMLKKYDMAVKRYEALKKQGDRSFLTLYYLGVSYYGDNWFYGAYDNLKEACRKNPKDVNVLYYLAKAASRTSWKEEGVDYMEEALRLTVPSDSVMARLYDGLAECYGHTGMCKKQIDALQKLYSYTRQATKLYEIASIYYREKDVKNATRYYKQFMAAVPEDRRYVLDEQGNRVEGRMTYYQQAERRIEKMKEESFFKGDVFDLDETIRPVKKDTLTSMSIQ